MVIVHSYVSLPKGKLDQLSNSKLRNIVLNGVEVLNPHGNLLDRQQKLGLMWNQKQSIKDSQK
jgi:hypothetical protein